MSRYVDVEHENKIYSLLVEFFIYTRAIIEEDAMCGACSAHSETNSQNMLVWKPEGKRSLGRPRRRGGNNRLLKWILEKYGLRVWIGLIWLRIGAGNEPLGAIQAAEFLE
jgi:hypothetical protein